MQQRRISFMTVFLPRENLFFIEEWLKYHIVLGFTHFYLYNNLGSRFIDCGNNIALNAKNKRGESISPLLAHYTDAEVQDALENILAPFVAQGYVTQAMWQPRDEHGNITYAQSLAFLDYVAKYARETDWVSFTDLDEFIVPLQHEDVQGLVDALEQEGFTYAILPQKCFASRFDTACQPRREVLRIFECSDWVTAEFGRKSLIKADTLRQTRCGSRRTRRTPFMPRESRKPCQSISVTGTLSGLIIINSMLGN
jgi:hypothetical protein